MEERRAIRTQIFQDLFRDLVFEDMFVCDPGDGRTASGGGRELA
jgi:hypothetical protein